MWTIRTPLRLLVATATVLPLALHRAGPGDWPAYGGDAGGSRFSPLTRVHRGNVAALRVAWTFHTGEARRGGMLHHASFEATPLVVDGTMYLSTPGGLVIALAPETGRVRWRFDARVDSTTHFGDYVSRGVSTWLDPAARPGSACRRRILVATVDARLIALDGGTGRPCAGFGTRGTVDLRQGLRNPPAFAGEYEETSPPAVVRGLVIVGSGVADNSRTDAASGEVRAFDARSGALVWTWDPVPQSPDDAAYSTWRGPEAHRTGAANAWSVIAADSAHDLVFVPTGSPSVDYFGGGRLGDNHYANSIVALRATTGHVVWHFQTVHHDLWDYDNASPPALVTVRRGGRAIPAVLQATKTGMLFVLDRETGRPIFPVEERPVPRSTVPGEEAAATQPFSTLPLLSPHRFLPDSAFGVSPERRAACRAHVAALRNEGAFTPPSMEGTLALPSNIGGAQWGGVAYDSSRGIVVVPVNRIAAEVRLVDTAGLRMDTLDMSESRIGENWTRMHGTPYVMHRMLLFGPDNVPCTPPPFGTLVAIQLGSGRKLWEVPLGDMSGLAKVPALRGMGSPNLGGPIATAGGLVFIAATVDRQLRAFDIETGREVWSAPLPAGGKATPMTYLGADGRQYVAIAAGGDGGGFGRDDALVAFALPSDGASTSAQSRRVPVQRGVLRRPGEGVPQIGGGVAGPVGVPQVGPSQHDEIGAARRQDGVDVGGR
jgi:quinoprotein glucose dehydrogenase